MKIRGIIKRSFIRSRRLFAGERRRTRGTQKDAASGFDTRARASSLPLKKRLLLPVVSLFALFFFFFFYRSPSILADPMHDDDDTPSRKIPPSRMRERERKPVAPVSENKYLFAAYPAALNIWPGALVPRSNFPLDSDSPLSRDTQTTIPIRLGELTRVGVRGRAEIYLNLVRVLFLFRHPNP